MSLTRSHRLAIALCVLFAQAASFAHLAIADHTLSERGHLVEACGAHEAAPEGVGGTDGTPGQAEDRCAVFEATTAPVELAQVGAVIVFEGTQLLAGGNVRRGFVRSALIDAPKASPPSRV